MGVQRTDVNRHLALATWYKSMVTKVQYQDQVQGAAAAYKQTPKGRPGMHSSLVLAFVSTMAAASSATAFVNNPSVLFRPSGRLSLGLSTRPNRAVSPSMQLDQKDKTFRRASVALRAEGDEQSDSPAGR